MIKNLRSDGVWNAVIYLRISKEDGDRDKKDESNSIRNQRDLALDFVGRNPDIKVAHILTDDGATGANFERNAFQTMIERVESGEVNCCVVKDFSRFSREHIGALKYIQRYFVSKNVRFIAINDGYDGLTADMNDTNTSLVLPFKMIVSEATLEDISVKTKSHLEMKRKNGELVCNYAAYGYVKAIDGNAKGRNGKRLEVDAYAADIVRGIFDKKLEGYSDAQIAGALNSGGILSPAEYKKSLGIPYSTPFAKAEKSLWTPNAVKRILTNRVYIGVLEQGKRTKGSYRMKKFFYKPREAWSVHADNHEPIISEADFELVQELLAKDTRVSAQGVLHTFSGFVTCGECGQPMIVKTTAKERKSGGRSAQYVYYVCATRKKYGDCGGGAISEAAIEKFALAALQAHIAGLAAEITADVDGNGDPADFGADTLQSRRKAAIERLIENALATIESYNDYIFQTYKNFLAGHITEAEQEKYIAGFNREIAGTESNIAHLRKELERVGDDKRTKELIARFTERGNITELNRRIVAGLIERIEVKGDKQLSIRFRFDETPRYVGSHSFDKTPRCVSSQGEENERLVINYGA